MYMSPTMMSTKNGSMIHGIIVSHPPHTVIAIEYSASDLCPTWNKVASIKRQFQAEYNREIVCVK